MTATIPGRWFVRNLVERRSLLQQLVRRDFEQRHVGSIGGWVWGLIHPFVLLVVYTFVFGICLGQGQVTKNYPFFLFAGILPWMLFADTVTRSAGSMVEQANLITKTVFPAEIVPIAIFCSGLATHGMALGITVAAAALYLQQFSAGLLVLPGYLLLLGMFAVGLGWIVASLQVYLRDTQQVVHVLMTLWFWTTPIFITEEQVPPGMRFLLEGNPLTYVVRAYRTVLLTNELPPLQDFLSFAAYAAAMFVVGGLFFRHMKNGFADVL